MAITDGQVIQFRHKLDFQKKSDYDPINPDGITKYFFPQELWADIAGPFYSYLVYNEEKLKDLRITAVVHPVDTLKS